MRKTIGFYDFSTLSVPVVVIPEKYKFHADTTRTAKKNAEALFGKASMFAVVSRDFHIFHFGDIPDDLYNNNYTMLAFLSNTDNGFFHYKNIAEPVRFELTYQDIIRNHYTEAQQKILAKYDEGCKQGLYAGLIFTQWLWRDIRDELDNTFELAGIDAHRVSGWEDDGWYPRP